MANLSNPSTMSTAGKFAPLTVSLSLLKGPLGVPLYFNGIMPALGYAHFAYRMSIKSVYIVALLLVSWFLLSCLANQVTWDVYARVVQLAGIVLFSNMVAMNLSTSFVSRMVTWCAMLFLFVMVVELFSNVHGSRRLDIFGPLLEMDRVDLGRIRLPRLQGVYGESNFSAAAVAIVFAFSLLLRRFWISILLFVILCMFLSRGGFAAAIFALLFLVLARTWPRMATLGAMTIVVLCSAVPFIILVVDSQIDNVLRGQIIFDSSRRYLHWVNFANFGLENPFFGVGYSKGIEHYQEYFRSWTIGNFSFVGGNQYQEAHNLFLDVFGEVGVIAYGLLVTFFYMVCWSGLRKDSMLSVVIVTVAIAYTFLSGVSDWGFWVVIGACVGWRREYRMPRV